MTKKERLSLILDLISKEEISTQEELTARLNEQGLDVSQATVSRDINELSLIKSEGVNRKSKYVKPFEKGEKIPPNIIELFNHVTQSIVVANNLIVIKSLVGNAGSVGMAVDAMKIPEIIGTVAGDDTLLVITKTSSDAEKVVKVLRTVQC